MCLVSSELDKFNMKPHSLFFCYEWPWNEWIHKRKSRSLSATSWQFGDTVRDLREAGHQRRCKRRPRRGGRRVTLLDVVNRRKLATGGLAADVVDAEWRSEQTWTPRTDAGHGLMSHLCSECSLLVPLLLLLLLSRCRPRRKSLCCTAPPSLICTGTSGCTEEDAVFRCNFRSKNFVQFFYASYELWGETLPGLFELATRISHSLSGSIALPC